jgi:hypothetical protein
MENEENYELNIKGVQKSWKCSKIMYEKTYWKIVKHVDKCRAKINK